MRRNPIKEKLRIGKPALGGWISFGHPGNVEVMCQGGFDWIALDAEHGYFTSSALYTCLDAMQNGEVSPIIRVPSNDAAVIKKVLDLGPEGIIIPMVSSREDAERAVQACKYPPEGIRGIGPGRASHYGKDKDYLTTANENILVVIQIENTAALENLDQIVTVKGIDAMFVGPADLSASMGLLGQPSHPDVLAAIREVVDAGKRAGIATGMWCSDEKHAAEMIKAGMALIAYRNDGGFLSAGIMSSMALLKRYIEEAGACSTGQGC